MQTKPCIIDLYALLFVAFGNPNSKVKESSGFIVCALTHDIIREKKRIKLNFMYLNYELFVRP